MLARRLGVPFLDTDAEIERRTGQTIRELFRDRGEAAFRAWEGRVLDDLRALPTRVVATGGGIVERAGARARLARLGLCIWLQVGEDELIRRLLRSRSRPVLGGRSVAGEASKLLRRRRPWYRAAADVTVRCGSASAAQIADRVERRIRSVERCWTRSRTGP